MKHVVPTETVAHLWANKAQDNARNGSNFYFNGDTIYSYGSHFPIARHVTNDKGQAAILFTTRTYSVTTAKHIGIVRQSIPGNVQVFKVYNVGRLDELTLDGYQSALNEEMKRIESATKSKESRLTWLNTYVTDFQSFAKYIGSKRKPKLPNAKWYAEQNAKVAKYKERQAWREANPTEAETLREKAREKREALAEKKREQEKQEQSAQFNSWLAGENVAFPHRYSEYGKDYLRVFNGQVETSRHAYVPMEHVTKVAPLLLRLIAEGKTYQRNGHTIHLGNYAIESLDASGLLTVGCHRFSKDEILRFAATLPADCQHQCDRIDGKCPACGMEVTA